jgi:hypothetical protein
MTIAMIEGMPNTNWSATAAELTMPMNAESACSAYIQWV